VRRREFITTAVSITAAALGSRTGLGQNRLFRIGYLASLAPEATPDLIGTFRQELKARGYMEGENLRIDYRWSALPSPALAAELIQLRPEVIVAWASPAVTAAKQATTTVPIVMVGIADPVAAGFVASLSRPGGNITGTTNLARDLGGKTLELLIELVPTLTSINVLRNPRNPASTFQFPDIEQAALALKRKIVVLDVSNDTELEQAFARMKQEDAQAVLALADPYLIEQRSRIARLARDARLLSIFSRRENVEAGGLLAYGPSLRAQFRETAVYVERILKGEKPAELPVQQPTTFELVINVTTARALGLTLPQTLLARADEVIE
jgi:putative ABC transport system substrate-binding protein